MSHAAFLTHDVPGCGGVFKASADDFIVEEIPAYEPNDEPDAEHLFLWVEKRELSTPQLGKALGLALGISDKEISWAGLKDRNAVTRQYVCLPYRKAHDKLAGLNIPNVKVLHAKRHRNKLKSGHLRGNRFTLKVRGVRDQGAAREVLARLKTKGLPNRFGDQRFGARGDNAERGKAILLAGGRHRDRFERKLFLSAFQSDLFNRVLAARLKAGTFDKALLGDVLKKQLTGGEFFCDAPDVDQPRVDAFEVSPTGPLFGPSMRAPTGAAAELEASVLAEEGIAPALFETGGGETQGARRLLRVIAEGLEAEFEGETLSLRFSLPAGSYATVLLAELLKDESA